MATEWKQPQPIWDRLGMFKKYFQKEIWHPSIKLDWKQAQDRELLFLKTFILLEHYFCSITNRYRQKHTLITYAYYHLSYILTDIARRKLASPACASLWALLWSGPVMILSWLPKPVPHSVRSDIGNSYNKNVYYFKGGDYQKTEKNSKFVFLSKTVLYNVL